MFAKLSLSEFAVKWLQTCSASLFINTGPYGAPPRDPGATWRTLPQPSAPYSHHHFRARRLARAQLLKYIARCTHSHHTPALSTSECPSPRVARCSEIPGLPVRRARAPVYLWSCMAADFRKTTEHQLLHGLKAQ